MEQRADILIAEDHTMLSHAVSRLLQDVFPNVAIAHCANPVDLRRSMLATTPRLLLLGFADPYLHMDAVLHACRHLQSPPAVVVLGDIDKESDTVGVVARLPRSTRPKDLIDALAPYLETTPSRFGHRDVQLALQTAGDAFAHLSPVQLAVIKMIAQGRTTSEIAEQLRVSLGTVRACAYGARRILGLTDNRDLGRWGRSHFGKD